MQNIPNSNTNWSAQENFCPTCGKLIKRATIELDIRLCKACRKTYCNKCTKPHICQKCRDKLQVPAEICDELDRITKINRKYFIISLIMFFGGFAAMVLPFAFNLFFNSPFSWIPVWIGIGSFVSGGIIICWKGGSIREKLTPLFSPYKGLGVRNNPPTKNAVKPAKVHEPTRCPSCGGDVSSGICFECGAKLCEYCGSLIASPDANNCPNCGKSLY